MTEDLMELTADAAEIEALAAKLNDLDSISDRERAILTGLFVLAGRAAADAAAEVGGFMPTAVENVTLNFTNVSGLPAYLRGTSSSGWDVKQSLPGGFSWGASAH
jgi:hypothetical protein